MWEENSSSFILFLIICSNSFLLFDPNLILCLILFIIFLLIAKSGLKSLKDYFLIYNLAQRNQIFYSINNIISLITFFKKTSKPNISDELSSLFSNWYYNFLAPIRWLDTLRRSISFKWLRRLIGWKLLYSPAKKLLLIKQKKFHFIKESLKYVFKKKNHL